MAEVGFPASTGKSVAALRARYLSAQLRGDRKEALRLIIDEGLSQGMSSSEVQLQVIQEAQREIGQLWQENTISVAQEHMATAISNVALAHLYQHAQAQPPNGKSVIVSCVEGELHDFPARLVADALDLAGFEVRFLGANVPTDSLLSLVRSSPPDLLALSVTMAFNVPSLRTAVARLRQEFGPAFPIAVGGAACVWAKGVTGDLQVQVTGDDAASLVSAAEQYLNISPRGDGGPR